MVTKKQRRTGEIKKKKKKKGTRLMILLLITLAVFGSIIFFFLTLFDSLYPSVTGKGEGAYSKKEKWVATLYFSDANERFLMSEKRQVMKDKDSAGQARELVKALLDGPKTKLVHTFPQKTELQSVKIEGRQRAVVSFSKNLIRNHPGGSASEMATIYSLTNTLTTNIPAIKEVKLLVDEKELESIGGHIDTRRPFVPNKDMLAPVAKEG
jgi:flagellar basal body-associated protein FliL